MCRGKLFLAAAVLTLVVSLAGACAGPGPAPSTAKTGSLQLYVTDALPKEVTAVEIKATNIEVHQSGAADDKWISVLKDPPVFDLVKIAGVNVLLGTSELAAGSYTQVRLDIAEVTVTVDGKQVKATVPSDKLRLVGTFAVEEGKQTPITLDFDGERSVVLAGKETVQFKPTVKLLTGKPGGKPEAASPPVTPSSLPLEGVTWVLQSYGQPGSLKPVLRGTEITALFDSATGQVTGSAGVNGYFGAYKLQGDKLSIPGPVGSTAMAGPQANMDQEQAYLTALQAAVSYSIKGSELQIDYGQQVLIFQLK
ncbi:MAG: DUF4382 domain-containing protein [Chloroflexota bacterium]